jgi:hypothetical protein
VSGTGLALRMVEVSRAAERTDGVRLGELLTALEPDAEAAGDALAGILHMAAVLRRILGGERGEGLLDGLDPVDTAIARQVLRRLADGEPERPL